ncbi:helix-turn-helix domain-containing protein, partial [Lysinibacillus sp. NPDC098008]
MAVGDSQSYPLSVKIETNIRVKREVFRVWVNKAYKFRIYPNKEQEIFIT